MPDESWPIIPTRLQEPDPDPEQAERDKRADLCAMCKPGDHEVCWAANNPDPTCSCCRSTLAALAEGNA